jgi:formate dehydrogenase iron-sulfur subunit
MYLEIQAHFHWAQIKWQASIQAEAAKRGAEINLIRNGSRGLFWLETMVEVATAKGRVAYGPVMPKDVVSLFDADFINGAAHPLNLGLTDEIAWLRNQERLTFARMGITDPVSVEDYVAHDGYNGLKNALVKSGADIVKEITDSGLRGRGGASLPNRD